MLVSLTAFAQGVGAIPVLPLPDEKNTLETLERRITGLSVNSDTLVIFPEQDQFMITLTYPGKVGSRSSFFGDLTLQERFPFELKGKRRWVGAYAFDDFLMVLDSINLQMLVVNSKTKKTLLESYVSWDLIKPARDRGGEATKDEIARTRANFRTAFRKNPQYAVSGMTFKEKDSRGTLQFLLASRVAGFPLLTMECRADTGDFYSCQIARQCFVSASLKGVKLQGIGFSSARSLVVMGDVANSELIYFKFNSCYDVREVGRRKLPAQLKGLSGVAIDEDDNLWVTTRDPDDFLNASVFRWDKSTW